MNAMMSASVFAALLTLAGHAGAQAGLKPPVNAKPGTGKTANVIMTEGGTAPCPKGPDGADACTVTVTGERSGDGGGGDAPCAMSGCSGSLPSYDPGRDTGQGLGNGDQKLVKWLKCGTDEDAKQRNIDKAFDEAMLRCVRDNADSSGSVGIGGTVQGTGGSITLPADWFTRPAVKRQQCESAAKAERNTETALNKARADSCRTRAANGG